MGSLKGKNIAALGLSFKPDTDDIRESPALDLINRLKKAGASIRAYDPAAMKNARQVLPDITYCRGAYSALKGADAVVILTEWNEFRNLDLKRARGLMSGPHFFDLRNIYEAEVVKQAGFEYVCMGRPS
jgi:UDPglucose 6-dehydrogenase